mmetsp:Transcript_11746/g.24031  ORF Transcript_11746/g.24031 Transcript_11746/m.24031 type:complete len:341 (-) Transcript_11746:19-1041(-)
MGNCFAKIDFLTSKEKRRLENANLDDFAVMMAFMELSLCTMREMERLYIAFDHIGGPITGQEDCIAIEDALRFLGITPNVFIDQVFTAPAKMQSDYSEFKRIEAGGEKKTPAELRDERIRKQSVAANSVPTLTFAQFCMAIYMLTFIEIPSLAFNMYDTDGSNSLDLAEVKQLVFNVYGATGAATGEDGVDVRVKQVLDGMDADHDGDISKEEFAALVQNFHYILLPAFQVQNGVRTKIFGGYVNWVQQEEKNKATRYTTLVDIVKRIDKIAQEQILVYQGKEDDLKGKVLGEDFKEDDVEDKKILDMVQPINEKSVRETKRLAAEDKVIVESHRAHRAL